MSQAGILKISSGSLPPSVPTSFVTDSGTAIPVANILNVLGGEGIDISGAGNTVTVSGEDATAGANAGLANKGIASFDSASFTVTAGFVTLNGSSTNIASVNVDANTAPGTDPVLPDGSGQITITGGQVAPGTIGANVIRSNSLAANSLTMEIQRSAAVGAPVLASNGVCHFDSAMFTVTPSGFVSTNSSAIPNTITGDTGGALSPTAGNWNILGQQASTIAVMDTVGTAPSTLRVEDRTWVSQFVVDPSATVGLRGTFTTIQSAITAASSGQTIYVRPGSYTENLTLKAGITIASLPGNPYNNLVQITGSITGTYAGIASITGCKLVGTTAGGIILSGASGTQLYVKDCIVYSFGGSGTNYSCATSNAANSVNFYNCLFDLDVFGTFFNVSAGSIIVDSCVFSPNTGGSSVANLLSGGSVTMHNTAFGTANIAQTPWTISGGTFTAINCALNTAITTSATSVLEIDNCRIYRNNATPLTLGGTSHNVLGCQIFSGSASAVSVSTNVFLSSCSILSTNANAITGAGTVTFSGLTFTGTSATSTINTTTQVPSVRSNDALKIVTPGAYPYTTVPQDAVILVDTSSARTITPLASPTTGQRHIIKDNVGSAAANNITITPSGKNIDGAASSIINIAYGSVTIVYNGTQWNVI